MQISNEPSHPSISNHLDEIANSKGFEIESRIVTLQSNFSIFEGNYKDLMHFISLAREPENFHRLFNSDFGNNVLKHITRYFHNFIAASMTLVDTTRVYMKKHYENTEFQKEYSKEIEGRFANSSLHNFIKDLRNFSLHYELPVSSLTIAITNSDNAQQELVKFCINKNRLDKWAGWNKGKQFLKAQNGDINIELLVKQYYSLVKDFHVWMCRRLQEIHQPELAELEQGRIVASQLLEQIKNSSSSA